MRKMRILNYFDCSEFLNKMPMLTSRTLFSVGEAIHPNDLGNSEVLNFSTSVDNRLKDIYKWKGQALGAVGLTLSADNAKVIGGQFMTRGTTSFKDEISLQFYMQRQYT
jgi:hypothetical protein